MPDQPNDGAGLEARFQRLYLAQGIFAERQLIPAVSPDRGIVATDVDVLVSEYNYGFHPTRLHAECKGGDIGPLDRVLWLAGVRRLLEADASYLVLRDFGNEVARFAWNLDIKLLSIKQLGEWEASLGVNIDQWPARSDFRTISTAKARWKALADNNRRDSNWQLVRRALNFIEYESWLAFSFGRLNRALRLLMELSRAYKVPDIDLQLSIRYSASGIAVRLSQYLLAVCLDVTNVSSVDMKEYLYGRLTFGDHDARNSTGLIDSAVTWIKRALEQGGASLPRTIDVSRLYARPAYSDEFVELIARLLRESHNARHLPFAMEIEQYGQKDAIQNLPMLAASAKNGESLAALLKAFLFRDLGLQKELLSPIGEELHSRYRVRTEIPSQPASSRGMRSRASRPRTAGSAQPTLDDAPANAVNTAISSPALGEPSALGEEPLPGDEAPATSVDQGPPDLPTTD